jgi:hypothetical protein
MGIIERKLNVYMKRSSLLQRRPLTRTDHQHARQPRATNWSPSLIEAIMDAICLAHAGFFSWSICRRVRSSLAIRVPGTYFNETARGLSISFSALALLQAPPTKKTPPATPALDKNWRRVRHLASESVWPSVFMTSPRFSLGTQIYFRLFGCFVKAQYCLLRSEDKFRCIVKGFNQVSRLESNKRQDDLMWRQVIDWPT